MPFLLEQGAFPLGVAVGVLGLVLVLSLIVAWAYEERTLLALAVYLGLLVGAAFLLTRAGLENSVISPTLLIAGPPLWDSVY
jgi:lysylphosphatidylglycerol synthetase-like protein (DUF2156 family)